MDGSSLANRKSARSATRLAVGGVILATVFTACGGTATSAVPSTPASGSPAASVQGAPGELLVLGNATHIQTLRAIGPAEGGVDVLSPMEAELNVKVVISETTNQALQEALQRLGPLSSVNEDIIFVHMYDTNARLKDFLEPLDSYLAAKPIDAFPDEWAPGIAAASVIDGQRYTIPFRCGALTMWYNDELFKERGIDGPPSTPEDLYEIAKAGTFVRADGEQVFGVAFRGDRFDITEDVAILARMFGGEIVTPDGQVTVNQPAAVAAVELLKRLYAEGLMPSNWSSLNQAAINELFKQGRVALTLGGGNFMKTFNDGESPVDGHAVPAHWPLVAELQTAEKAFSDGTAFHWGVGILKGSANKELAAEFIRTISQPSAVHEIAVNGSGPCMSGELAVQAASDPGIAIAAEILPVSRGPVLAHPNINQIRDSLGEVVQNIVTNNLAVQPELDALAARLERLYR